MENELGLGQRFGYSEFLRGDFEGRGGRGAWRIISLCIILSELSLSF